MDDQSLLRYNRQIMLPDIDISGQEALLNAHVMIVGVGGLGSPAAMYLASAGVGTITLVDFDTVELSNLQRQIIHDTQSLGMLKVESAQERLLALNPEIRVHCLSQKLNSKTLKPYLKHITVLLDCSDNFETRYALNALALDAKIPLVSGAAIGMDGQISVFDFRDPESPCYRCLFPAREQEQNLSCSENGVLGPVVGIIGSFQALETCKLITQTGNSLQGTFLSFDGRRALWRRLNLQRDSECISCGRR